MAFAAFEQGWDHGYFAEAMGQPCFDGDIPGTLTSVSRTMLFALRKPIPFPFPKDFDGLSQDDVFDVVEFLFDHVSEPQGSDYHRYNDCGWHFRDFDRAAGQRWWRNQLNAILPDFGYEMSAGGEIQEVAPPGLATLLEQPIPELNEGNASQKVEAAIRKYRSRTASLDQRRDAVRELIDILEYLRPRLSTVLTKQDENDLFNLANNFGLRHWNEKQRVGYEADVWLTFMFYFYLATVHVVLRLLIRSERNPS